MRRALPYIFFFAWLLCGCSIDHMLDDWRACIIFVIALIVAILCAVVLNYHDE